jgi:hypothetical protein
MYNKNKTNTMNKEFLKMQKLAGLITENQSKQIDENQNDFNTIEKVISKYEYPVTDLESLFDEMEETDLVDVIADEMGVDLDKARKALKAYGMAKYYNSPKHLDQEAYMDALNLFFSALGNGADAYDDSTWTKNEKDLARNIASILFQAGVDIS